MKKVGKLIIATGVTAIPSAFFFMFFTFVAYFYLFFTNQRWSIDFDYFGINGVKLYLTCESYGGYFKAYYGIDFSLFLLVICAISTVFLLIFLSTLLKEIKKNRKLNNPSTQAKVVIAKVNGKKIKKKLLVFSLIIAICFLLYAIVMGTCSFDGAKGDSYTIHQSSVPVYSSLEVLDASTSYVFPTAKYSFSITNPYANEVKDFHFFASFDNESWVEIPLANSTNYVEIGRGPSNNDFKTIYIKYIFPTQNTITSASDFLFHSKIEPIWTPQTYVIMIVLSVAIFLFTFKILEYIFLR